MCVLHVSSESGRCRGLMVLAGNDLSRATYSAGHFACDREEKMK